MNDQELETIKQELLQLKRFLQTDAGMTHEGQQWVDRRVDEITLRMAVYDLYELLTKYRRLGQ